MILLILAGLLYCVYVMIIQPILFRRKFMKYENVYVSPKFNLLIGDLDDSIKDEGENKIFYEHMKDQAQQMNKYDMRVEMEGMVRMITLISDK